MSKALRVALLLIVFGCATLFLAHPYWFPADASSSSMPIDHQFKIAFWIFGALFIVGHLVLIFVLSKTPFADRRLSIGSWRLEVTWTLAVTRSEEHTSELQSHSFISYAVFCLK